MVTSIPSPDLVLQHQAYHLTRNERWQILAGMARPLRIEMMNGRSATTRIGCDFWSRWRNMP